MRFSRFSRSLRAAALIVTVASAGCAPDGGAGHDRAPESPRPDPGPPALAAVESEWPGVVIEIVGARRVGSVLAVEFRFVNRSPRPFEFADRFAADPADRGTLADIALVETTGLRKYWVLRDRAGRPVCSTAVSPLEPGERRVLFARFPAPPEGTSRVSIQIPHVPEMRDVPVGR